MYEHPKPVTFKTLDEIVGRVEKEVPDDAGTVYVARWVRDRLREAMSESGTVFYQP